MRASPEEVAMYLACAFFPRSLYYVSIPCTQVLEAPSRS